MRLVLATGVGIALLFARASNAQEHPAFSLERCSSYFLVFSQEKVQEELELVAAQKAEVEKAVEIARGDLGELYRLFEAANDVEREQLLSEAKTRIAAFDLMLMREVFLPHQRKAWDALILKQHLDRHGLFAVLFQGAILELTDEQRRELREMALTEAAEIEKKAVAIQNESMQRLLAVLSDEQREKLRDLVGSEPISRSGLSKYIDQLRSIDGSCAGCEIVLDSGLKQVVMPQLKSVLEKED